MSFANRRLSPWIVLLLCFAPTGPLAAAVFTVTTTADSGAGSLRDAIAAANGAAGADVIEFAIPGAGPHTISPLTALPWITDPVTIDGYTQPGSSENTLAIGNDAVLQIVLDGGALASGIGLEIRAPDSTIRGLVVHSFPQRGIRMFGSVDNTVIEGNFIGTDVTGTVALGNGGGVQFFTAFSGGRIGGGTPADRNVISGNRQEGISLGGASNHEIVGNYIGADATGLSALGNAGAGITATSGGSGLTIGGTGPGDGNVIADNFNGISLSGTTGTVIEGNWIGTDALGVGVIGQTSTGVIWNASEVTIGGTVPEAANIIAHNNGHGIGTSTTNAGGAEILGNAIFDNGQLGIDLKDARVTANDACDPDIGPSNLQNYPELASAVSNASGTAIAGTLDSTPGTLFTVELFSNAACDPSGFGEGEVFVGTTTVLTDVSCLGSLFLALPTPIALGRFVTATATDEDGFTSEFSACVEVTSAGPDLDSDGVDDTEDNCPLIPNPSQTDSGGLDTTTPNGIGDSCECGDINANGLVQINDATIIKRALLGLGPGIAHPGKCNVIGATDPSLIDVGLGVTADCAINDATVVKRAILGLGPGIGAVCAGVPEAP